MFCKEDDDSDSVYIGEAENIKERLKKHLNDYKADREKYYWNTAVIFTGRDLNKTLIRYLEKRFVEIARDCNRYKLLTKNTYKNTVIKESQKATMEEFIENVKVLINTLNYKVLDPVVDVCNNQEYLYITNKRGADAKGFVSDEGFVVLKGSLITKETTPSFLNDKYFKLRFELIEQEIIIHSEFQKDYIFSSPSASSSVIVGNATNGRLEWKNSEGKTLKEINI